MALMAQTVSLPGEQAGGSRKALPCRPGVLVTWPRQASEFIPGHPDNITVLPTGLGLCKIYSPNHTSSLQSVIQQVALSIPCSQALGFAYVQRITNTLPNVTVRDSPVSIPSQICFPQVCTTKASQGAETGMLQFPRQLD